MLIEDLIERLKERVPDFSGRVEGALNWAELKAQGRLPQTTPAANVISVGLQGGTPDAAAGLFRQAYDEVFGVILTFRNNDAVGRRAFERSEEIKRAVIEAVAGWSPKGVLGTFRLARGTLVAIDAGTLSFQIDFAIGDQLRIDPS
ncbi:hypothetical protein [Tabrizicola sp.]|uniref:phage tail terminator protein n=1 Tax=Tabrizicola sp. TaxID=2005166 RepID=UPI0025E37B6D|nr:hypothetical protein [Tabrizicola sp.]